NAIEVSRSAHFLEIADALQIGRCLDFLDYLLDMRSGVLPGHQKFPVKPSESRQGVVGGNSWRGKWRILALAPAVACLYPFLLPMRSCSARTAPANGELPRRISRSDHLLGVGTTRCRFGSPPTLGRSGFLALAFRTRTLSPGRSLPSTRLRTRRTDTAPPPTTHTSSPSFPTPSGTAGCTSAAPGRSGTPASSATRTPLPGVCSRVRSCARSDTPGSST